MPTTRKRPPGSKSKALLRLASEYHCDSLAITWLIPAEWFDRAEFESSFLRLLGPDFTLEESPDAAPISGPLRLGDQQVQDVALGARIAYHDHETVKHYYIELTATHRAKAVRVANTLPSVADFLVALRRSVGDKKIAWLVSGEHRFPTKHWSGKMELVVPLPAPKDEEGFSARLTGWQVTYEKKGVSEKVLLVVSDAELSASTQSVSLATIESDAVEVASRRSHEIALRLVNEIATKDDA